MTANTHAFQMAPLRDIDTAAVYKILQLRVNVFVVEQACPYPELDGRDLDADTTIVWSEDAEGVQGTLRILVDEESLRIGRVVAHPRMRGTAYARRMMEFALHRCAEMNPELPVVLDAQAPLEHWYGRFGFVRAGDTFLEDGIPHVPMTKPAEPR